MKTDRVQRWREGRDFYRPAGEVIDTSRYEVASIADDNTPKAFIVSHHYSGSYPAARKRFGLYRNTGDLVGVAVFSHPAQPRCLDVLPGERLESIELGRFVLIDDVPANGETWFLARCFELLRADAITGVVSFSDPVARTLGDGTLIFGGHIGTIYQAHNATYLGRSKPRKLRLLPDGTCLHPRALAKLKKREKGHRYVTAKLEGYGCDFGAFATVVEAVDSVTHTIRHTGNHKYAWTLNRRDRRHLPTSLPYPKVLS